MKTQETNESSEQNAVGFLAIPLFYIGLFLLFMLGSWLVFSPPSFGLLVSKTFQFYAIAFFFGTFIFPPSNWAQVALNAIIVILSLLFAGLLLP